MRTVDRLRRLVDDLLDVSRLERGLFFIDRRPVDVAALVRDTADAFAGGEARIELALTGQLFAHAGPDRLQQAPETCSPTRRPFPAGRCGARGRL